MSFLRFYDGAVPGKKGRPKKQMEHGKRKQNPGELNMRKSEVVVNIVRNGERVENG